VRIRNAQLLAAKVSSPRFRGKVGNSPDISKAIFELGMCEFESSQVSQAVTQPEIVSNYSLERPANGGFLTVSYQSLVSQFTQFESEITESLWHLG
jgi:hypothetical protein